MWGFQVPLGSLGKQPCLATSTAPCPLQQAHAEGKPSSCNRDLSVTTHLSTHKLLLPLTCTYFTLLVSDFYTEFKDTSFLPPLLFLSPLSHGWMKPQKAKPNTLLAPNILQNEATSWLHLKPSSQSHSASHSQNATSPNLMDSKKPGTWPQPRTFACRESAHQPSFLPNAR